MKQTPNFPDFLTAGEVAAVLGCSRQWVHELVNSGDLKYYHVGKSKWNRFDIADIEEYARKNNIELNWDAVKLQERVGESA